DPGLSGIDGSSYFTIMDQKTLKSPLNLLKHLSIQPVPSDIHSLLDQIDLDKNFIGFGEFSSLKKFWVSVDNSLYIFGSDNFASQLHVLQLTEEAILSTTMIERPEEMFKYTESHILFISTASSLHIYLVTIENETVMARKENILDSLQCTGIEQMLHLDCGRLIAKSFDGNILEILLK
ncbi:MAG: hypothetical protein MHPSP_001840, partial [Paramarteilia canceri]